MERRWVVATTGGSGVVDLVMLLAATAGLAVAVSSAGLAALAAQRGVLRAAIGAAGAHLAEVHADLPVCPSSVEVDAGPARVRVCASSPVVTARGGLSVKTAVVGTDTGDHLSLVASVSSCRVPADGRVVDMILGSSGPPVRWDAAVVEWQADGEPRLITGLEWRSRGIMLWSSSVGAASGATLQFVQPAVISTGVLRLVWSDSLVLPIRISLTPIGRVRMWGTSCEVSG